MQRFRIKKTLSRVDRLSNVAKRIRRVPKGEQISLPTLFQLMFAWGNFGYSANIRYLQQVERIFRESTGSVLECGSGATTILLALLTEKYERDVWTFENHEGWGDHVRGIVRALKLENIRVCYTPLKNYGEYEWYNLPSTPIAEDFGLVVCDGPPGKIQGGRYGLLPVMQDYLKDDCRILLDDAHRQKEKELIRRWASERKISWDAIGLTKRCAKIGLLM